MPLRVLAGELLLWAGDLTAGLSETSTNFSSREELDAYCLSAGETQCIDRIVIRGQGGVDQPRVLTFVFQSITVSFRPEYLHRVYPCPSTPI